MTAGIEGATAPTGLGGGRAGRTRVLTDLPHHDGSESYAPQGALALGDAVPVRVRVPHGPDAPGDDDVWVRVVQDGEPCLVQARPERRDEHETWFVADVVAHNPITSYRFFLGPSTRPGGHRWLTGRGVANRDVSDASDFRLSTHAPAPDWGTGSFVYQVFPDRFARSGRAAAHETPDWAEPRSWNDPVDGFGPGAGRQLYGGDLWGIGEHLDHLERLGVDVLYLTPSFPGRSNHRYDATTFDRIDPLLGGDEALAALARAVHARGMRIMGDLTTNHTGAGHEWFRRALAEPSSPEHDYYYWTPDGHVGWLGHASLPKLDHGAPGLADRLVRGPGSVVGRWLGGDGDLDAGLDGWRIDVANMTGRYRDADRAHAVAREIRSTMAQVRPDALLVGEHFHDSGADAQGDGWHAVMNYSAFTRPLWSWLAPEGSVRSLELPGPIARRDGRATVATMREFASAVPWAVTRSQWNMLASHDTPRLRTIAGSADLARAAAAMLFTYPGTPVVFAGDELGLEGRNGEESRTPMPWDRPGDRDETTLAHYTTLARLRRSSRALREGGLRWVMVDDDAVAYVRETADERVLVLVSRAPWPGAHLPAGTLLGSDVPETMLGDAPLRVSGTGAHRVLELPGDGPAAYVWRLA